MALRFITFTVLFLLGFAGAVHKSRFDNYRVYSLNVSSVKQLQALSQLENGVAGSYDFWRSPKNVGDQADIMVAPHQRAAFVEIIDDLRMSSSVMIDDVQSLIDKEKPSARASRLSWTAYHDLDTIYEWLDDQLLAYPNILSNLTVGLSYQNRTIRAVRLSHKEGNPTVFIESNIHAREWITSATATWFLNELLTSTDTDVQDLARNIDWVIVPVFNVDGFAYSHSVNRMWRKTRQPHGYLCAGCDPNRNFGYKWMEIGANQNVCSDIYAGPKAFSEPETRALADFIESFSGKIKIFLAFHSYGQYFMFPWGFTSDPVRNYNALSAVANKTREAIAQKYGTAYSVGPSSTTIYPTSGSSVDWAYGTQNIQSTYTIEFRDQGRYGFMLPAAQIVENGEEVLDGLIAMVSESRQQNLL